jgi:hypothetical protein
MKLCYVVQGEREKEKLQNRDKGPITRLRCRFEHTNEIDTSRN